METLNNFIYEYFIRHQAELKQFQTPAEFYTGFKKDAEVWNELVAYAKKDSINLEGIDPVNRSQVEIRVKALLARFIWRTQGYYLYYESNRSCFKKSNGVVGNQQLHSFSSKD